MRNVLNIVPPERNLPKLRVIFACAFICSPLFYMFMIRIFPNDLDFPAGRIFISLISLISLLLTYSKNPFRFVRFSLNFVMASYICVYGYFLQLNHWSVFHRWSYFVVVFIVVTAVVTWRDYIYLFLIGFFFPMLFLKSSPMTSLETIHFFVTVIVTFFVIGITMNLNFRYQNEVIKLTKNLIESSKMAALGELSGNLSHEINNPLAILTLSNRQLENFINKGVQDPSQYKATLTRISDAINRIAYVVKGLGQFSQMHEDEITQMVDLEELFREASSLFLEKLKSESIELIIHHSEIRPLTSGRRSDLGQVFMILLNNAFDFCKRSEHPRQIKVRFAVEEQIVKVIIQDSGPGVPVDLEDRIFEPFFTTKDIGQGVGLGLSTALGIAKAHKGNLSLDRHISSSCFILCLPRVSENAYLG